MSKRALSVFLVGMLVVMGFTLQSGAVETETEPLSQVMTQEDFTAKR